MRNVPVTRKLASLHAFGLKSHGRAGQLGDRPHDMALSARRPPLEVERIPAVVLHVSGVNRVAALSAVVAACACALVGARPAAAAQCGLPDAQPWWIDFASGSVSF